MANKIALGQIDCGIAGGVDTTSDAPLALNEDLRELLLEASRTKSTTARLCLLARLRPQQRVSEIPRNSEPRTGDERHLALPGDLGRRYGAISGDLNPIHVHPLTARLFRFSSAIAHGMWTLARCVAALHPLHHDAVTVEAAFRRPILLPATVAFSEGRERGTIRFGVRDARRDTPHLDGRLTF